MEIEAFAKRVLFSETLKEKLKKIDLPITDNSPGLALVVDEPGRPANLKFAAPRKAPAMPKPSSFQENSCLATAHHIMANHELQALEVMARVLLEFPDTPTEFRHGMINIMHDEQRHTLLHSNLSASLGIPFGELPVNCYIWKKSAVFENILDYLACLPLVFEGCNLDHTLEFENYFTNVDASQSAKIMRTIHNDEIQHVAFGWHWLNELKPPELSMWDAWVTHLKWPLRPSKAAGNNFNLQPRLDAGMTMEFVERLQQAIENDEEIGPRI